MPPSSSLPNSGAGRRTGTGRRSAWDPSSAWSPPRATWLTSSTASSPGWACPCSSATGSRGADRRRRAGRRRRFAIVLIDSLPPLSEVALRHRDQQRSRGASCADDRGCGFARPWFDVLRNPEAPIVHSRSATTMFLAFKDRPSDSPLSSASGTPTASAPGPSSPSLRRTASWSSPVIAVASA